MCVCPLCVCAHVWDWLPLINKICGSLGKLRVGGRVAASFKVPVTGKLVRSLPQAPISLEEEQRFPLLRPCAWLVAEYFYPGSTLEARQCFGLNALLAQSATSNPFWKQAGYKLQINKISPEAAAGAIRWKDVEVLPLIGASFTEVLPAGERRTCGLTSLFFRKSAMCPPHSLHLRLQFHRRKSLSHLLCVK